MQAALALMRPRGTIRLPLVDCLGHVLADEVATPLPLPPFDNSAMDGYAVRSVDVAGAPVELVVTADLPAGGIAPEPLTPQTAQRIMTGAQIPPGADAVVRVEWTTPGPNRVRIDRPVRSGESVRCRGEDVKCGDVVLHAGELITPARLAIAASIGSAELNVYPQVRVAVFATGDELISPGVELAQGQIYDSNSFLISSLVRQAGGVLTTVRTLGDDIETARVELEAASKNSDLIITSGGISAGAYEVVKEALADNPNIEFVSVAMQPGKPQGVGVLNGVPLLAFPGNPVSSFVSFEVFARPAMRKLAGSAKLDAFSASAILVNAVKQKDRQQFLPGSWDTQGSLVSSAPRFGSHLITLLGSANCLIVIPPGIDEIPAGSTVRIMIVGVDS